MFARSTARPEILALALLATAAGCSEPRQPTTREEASGLPRLVVEGAETFPDQAARIDRLDPARLTAAMDLVGLQSPGDPVYLVLVPENASVARSTPAWIAGYAYSSRSVAVLFPARSPTYPDSTFEELILHEVGHILVHRAAGAGEVPRWFNEGLALFVGRPWRLRDHSRVTWALVSGRRVSLADLDLYFNMSRAAAGHAYALAGAFVHDLLTRHGPQPASRILSLVASGSTFEQAFRQATGMSLEQAEASFWKRHTFLYRWVPVLTSSVSLWTAITLLALFAIRRRRARDAALRELWEQENGLGGRSEEPQSSA